MPPRDNPLDWLGQFVEVRQAEPNLVWTTTNGHRAHITYIDEMADQWRTCFEDEFVNEELLRTLMGDWKVSPTVAKVEVEPEDVDPDEFEKILNGG